MIRTFAQTETTVQNEAVLFAFDDHSIPATRNLGLHMVHPEKHPGNPVLKRGEPGAPDAHRAACFGTVLYENGKFRMWYNASPLDECFTTEYSVPENAEDFTDFVEGLSNFSFFICYAESEDGIRWEKPHLGLHEFNGSTANNIVLKIGEGFGFPCVLHEPEAADPNQRYKMVLEKFYNFTGWNTERGRITGFFTSPDGKNWTELKTSRLICQQTEVAALYKFNGEYRIGGQQISPLLTMPPDGVNCGRTMVVFSSPQFDAWPEEETIAFFKPMASSAPGSTFDGEEVHLGASVWSRGNVCVGIYGQWHMKDGDQEEVSVDLGLVVSNDGLHFREPAPGFHFMERDQELGWDRDATSDGGDNMLLLQASAFANVGDKTYLWYAASSAGGNTMNVTENTGLATLRRDGFGYLTLNPAATDGSLLTCCLEASEAKSLYLNADRVEDSPLYIEIMDAAGLAPLKGYEQGDICTVTESGVRVQVRTKDGSILRSPVNQKFRIRVSMQRGARIFALYIAD